MFRNLFNHLRLTDLAMLNQYTCEYLSWKPALGARWTSGTMSVILRFAATGLETAFDIHAYLEPDGRIAASGMLDPKAIHIPHRYHFIPAPERTSLTIVEGTRP